MQHHSPAGVGVGIVGLGLAVLSPFADDLADVVGLTGMPNEIQVGLAIVGIVLIVVGVVVEVRSWRSRRRGKPTDNKRQGGPRGSLTVLEAAPALDRERVVNFGTAGRLDHEVPTQGRPRALRFVEPVEREIREGDLPVALRRHRRPILVVRAFTDSGFVIDDKTSGVKCRAEVYYERDLSKEK